MQKAIYILSFLCCIIGMQQLASAQCAYDNTQFGTYLAPTTVGTDVVLSTCFYGGEYAYVTGLVAGNTYRFSTCGDTDF
jgi:NADH:ubiquinone oxidoreductase subunit B-like Fe-S oxidoreductase